MSEVEPGTVHLLPHSAAPGQYEMREAVEVVALKTLACSFQGEPTLLLHWWGRPKPWAPDLGRV